MFMMMMVMDIVIDCEAMCVPLLPASHIRQASILPDASLPVTIRIAQLYLLYTHISAS